MNNIYIRREGVPQKRTKAHKGGKGWRGLGESDVLLITVLKNWDQLWKVYNKSHWKILVNKFIFIKIAGL